MGGNYFEKPVNVSTGTQLHVIDNQLTVVPASCIPDVYGNCGNGISFQSAVNFGAEADLNIVGNTITGSNIVGIYLGNVGFTTTVLDEVTCRWPTVHIEGNNISITEYGRGVWVSSNDQHLLGGGNVDIEGNSINLQLDGNVLFMVPILVRLYQDDNAVVPCVIDIAFNTITGQNFDAAISITLELNAPQSKVHLAYNTISCSGTQQPNLYGSDSFYLADTLFHVIGNRLTTSVETPDAILFTLNNVFSNYFGTSFFLYCNNSITNSAALIETTPTTFAGAINASTGVTLLTSSCYRCGCTNNIDGADDPLDWCRDQQYCCSYSTPASGKTVDLRCPQPTP